MYQKSDELQEIMQTVILDNAEFAKLANVRIACLISDRRKMSNGKIIYADCTKVSDKMKPVTYCDFIITFYGDALIQDLEIQRRIMYHELLYVGYDAESEKYYIVPHDLEDFKACIDKWGTDWVNADE